MSHGLVLPQRTIYKVLRNLYNLWPFPHMELQHGEYPRKTTGFIIHFTGLKPHGGNSVEYLT